MQQQFQTQQLVRCSLFAALTAVLSQIIIPIGPVPINLALLAVLIAGGVLTVRYAFWSQLIYILLGAMGLPIFAGFAGGMGVIFGPTGGYIWGYLVAAMVVSWISQRFGYAKGILLGAMVLGVVLCYSLGTAWFMTITHSGLWQSLTLCVIPFIFGDMLKIILAMVVIKRLVK